MERVIQFAGIHVCDGMGLTPPRGTGRRIRLPLVGAVNLLPVVLAVALAAIAVPLIGCGGGGADSTSSESASGSAASTPSSSAGAVTISNYEYKPAEIIVPVGATVKVTNQDTTAHTVTSKEAGSFESGSIEPGKTATIKLEKPGTYAYYCAFHPFMKGTITVEE